ncbi:MAG: hypothetical protein P4L10_08390 [Acidobacteriaceae bacterium]|nr:hypothetical protein [Acidobacteriaceae bacterium]
MVLIDTSKWSFYASVAQILATIFAGITTLIAVWALSEVRKDRSLRARPYLLLDHGGFRVEVEQVDRLGIPGVNPAYAQRTIEKAGMKVTATWRAKHDWGRLINHGVGAAIGAEIIIITKAVTRSGETFKIDNIKLQCCPYEPALNTIPANPSHIEPGKSANFFRLPTLVVLDSNSAVSSAACEIIIRYKDIFGKKYENRQSLLISDERTAPKPYFIFSFGDDI